MKKVRVGSVVSVKSRSIFTYSKYCFGTDPDLLILEDDVGIVERYVPETGLWKVRFWRSIASNKDTGLPINYEHIDEKDLIVHINPLCPRCEKEFP